MNSIKLETKFLTFKAVRNKGSLASCFYDVKTFISNWKITQAVLIFDDYYATIAHNTTFADIKQKYESFIKTQKEYEETKSNNL